MFKSRYLGAFFAFGLGLSSISALANYGSVAQNNAFAGKDGPYLSLYLAFAKPLNQTYDDATEDTEASNSYTVRSKKSMGGGGTFGYQMGSYQIGLDVSYAKNDKALKDGLTDVKINGTETSLDNEDSALLAGTQKTTTAMVNVTYDLNPKSNVTPFVGFGLGFMNIKQNYLINEGDAGSQAPTNEIDSSDTLFAYQALVGIKWAVTNDFYIGIDYRYLSSVSNAQFDITNTTYDSAGIADSTTYTVEGKHASHRINLGATYYLS